MTWQYGQRIIGAPAYSGPPHTLRTRAPTPSLGANDREFFFLSSHLPPYHGGGGDGSPLPRSIGLNREVVDVYNNNIGIVVIIIMRYTGDENATAAAAAAAAAAVVVKTTSTDGYRSAVVLAAAHDMIFAKNASVRGQPIESRMETVEEKKEDGFIKAYHDCSNSSVSHYMVGSCTITIHKKKSHKRYNLRNKQSQCCIDHVVSPNYIITLSAPRIV
ncbi:hypothetical protein QTP88_015829 [Uroleucon formosanum]